MLGNRLLVVAAHADDEAIGCGGLLMKFPGPKALIVLTEMRTKELNRANKFYGAEVYQFKYEDQILDTVSQLELNKHIEAVIERFQPDIVVTHSIHDNNVDHQMVHKSVNVAARFIPNILYFHIPSTGEFHGFNSQVKVDVDAAKKVEVLSCYMKEMNKPSRKHLDPNVEYFEVGRLTL